MNQIVAFVWGAAAAIAGYITVVIALGPKADASGWLMALAFAAGTAYAVFRAWQEWSAPKDPASGPSRLAPRQQPPPAPTTDAPGAWPGNAIPLETQIDALREAGLSLNPGRTIDELLTSWPRADYERDPYNLIFFMYGCEVEAEPWGRAFCARGWNFDMECLTTAGDYVYAFTEIVRITGQPQIATDMSDDFDIDAETATISYTLNGRKTALRAIVDNDWADPEAVTAFVRDIEAAIGDGRHFWASDNGQASVLFFLTDAEAARINALRPAIIARYAAA